MLSASGRHDVQNRSLAVLEKLTHVLNPKRHIRVALRGVWRVFRDFHIVAFVLTSETDIGAENRWRIMTASSSLCDSSVSLVRLLQVSAVEYRLSIYQPVLRFHEFSNKSLGYMHTCEHVHLIVSRSPYK